MKAKWYRRVGGKHVKFNLSKSGVTTSFKLGPITINPQRNSYFIKTGIPGLSLRGKLDEANKETEQNETKMAGMELQGVDTGIAGRIILSVVAIIASFTLIDSYILSLIVCGSILFLVNHAFIGSIVGWIVGGKIGECMENIDINWTAIIVGGISILLVINVLLH